VTNELAAAWRDAAALEPEHELALPFPNEHVAVVGNGAARAIARAYATLREEAGHGLTEAGAPDELPKRPYDRTLLLTRTGEEPGLVELLGWLREQAILSIAVGAPSGSAVDELAGVTLPVRAPDAPGGIDGAWASTAFAILRAHTAGEHGAAEADAAARATPPDPAARTLLIGRGTALGLAETAKFVLRRAGAEIEAGPPSELVADTFDRGDDTLVWRFDEDDGAVRTWTERAGAHLRTAALGPAGELVLALRLADRLAGR
jgi:fructoselysine-6-P-deglycase FrlB-like protein